MTALLWCDKMYKNISKKLLHLTIEFFVSFRMEEYIMKKLSKRFLTLAIACVMAMMMAVPAFADFDNGTTHTYHIKNNTTVLALN